MKNFRLNILTIILLPFGLSSIHCVKHISEYEPKRRDYAPPVNFEQVGESTNTGSIFNPAHPGTYLFADQRAMRLGDIVTVRVKEEADAKRGAGTELSRSSETQLEIEAFFGALDSLDNEKLKNGNLLDALFDSDFAGSGKTSRSESMEATVPATVRTVLPNGNLFIEGHRVVLVNDEEHHFYLSGVIRPVDIQADNSVVSSVIADAEIEFTGRGVITDKQKQGWFNRSLDYVSPF